MRYASAKGKRCNVLRVTPVWCWLNLGAIILLFQGWQCSWSSKTYIEITSWFLYERPITVVFHSSSRNTLFQDPGHGVTPLLPQHLELAGRRYRSSRPSLLTYWTESQSGLQKKSLFSFQHLFIEYGGQRVLYRSQLPPSILWILRIKFRSLGLLASAILSEPPCQPTSSTFGQGKCALVKIWKKMQPWRMK